MAPWSTPHHDPQLLKGLLSLVLLHLLAEQESYGYEVVSRLRQEGIDVLEGTVYPALARLEREGRLSSRLVASTSGPARKYYRPTTEGYAELARGARSWRALTQTIGSAPTDPCPTNRRKDLDMPTNFTFSTGSGSRAASGRWTSSSTTSPASGASRRGERCAATSSPAGARTRQAFANLGTTRQLADEYLTAQYGPAPRGSWWSAAIFLRPRSWS